MTKTHRIGVIGSGGIAQQHVLGYQAAGAAVVALCDVNATTLAEKQKAWGVADGYTDANELLARSDIDAVSICTPNSSHHPLTVAAAKAGKHVHCEKPVSMDLANAQDMIDVCAKEGVVFQVGHHLRSWASAAKAKAMIERGDIGRVSYVRLRQAHDWGGLPVRGVFGSKAQSGGGTLLDNGCHLFDLARYLGGDVRDVYARVATLKYDVEVEDTAISSLGFASGAMGQVEVAWTGTGWQEAFWIYGTEGSLECDNRADGANVVVHRYRNSPATSWGDTDVARYVLQGGNSHHQHIANFLAAIDGTGPVVCNGDDGMEAVRLVLASYESAERNAVVSITAPQR